MYIFLFTLSFFLFFFFAIYKRTCVRLCAILFLCMSLRVYVYISSLK